MLAVLVAVFMIMLDTTIVNLAVPAIRNDLGATGTSGQWVVNSYNVTIAATMITAGTAADRVGARRAFGSGVVVFALASLAGALSPTVPALVAARVSQGLGAALVMTAGLALVAELHPADRTRARAFAWWAATVGIGTVLGPAAGGLLVDNIGWRAVFWLNVPLAALTLTALSTRGRATPGHLRSLDPGGQLLVIVVLAGAALAATVAGEGPRGAEFLIAIGVAGIAGVALTATERRVRTPMLPPDLLARRPFLAPVVLGGVLSFGIYGALFVLSVYFQLGRGLNATAAGFAILPFAATTTVAAPIAGRIIGRHGPRPVLLIGLIVSAVGAGVIAGTATIAPYWPLGCGEALLGIGHALLQPAINTAALYATPPTHTGTGSGVLATARQTGSVLGVALLGGLITDPESLHEGTRAAFVIIASLFAATVVLRSAGQAQFLQPRPSPLRKGKWS